MGAEGTVTAYDWDAMIDYYASHYPDRNIYDDLPYAKRGEGLILTLPGGYRRLLLDYRDDISHDGLADDWYFATSEDDLVFLNDRPHWAWQAPEPRPGYTWGSWYRVHEAMDSVWYQEVEVWT